jgi:CO/xanthine dehydrogenase FAD-binding subunit
VKPPPFRYRRVESLEDAYAQLAEGGEETKVLAGGQSLVPLLNFRLVRPTQLLDIGRLTALETFARDNDLLTVGALVRHHAVERALGAEVFRGYDVIPRAARLVGHYPIRVRGTFGGSVAHADPAAEWPMIVRLFDATIVVGSRRGERRIDAADFFIGFFTTALEPDELVLRIELVSPSAASTVQEFSRRAGDFAVVAAGVAIDADGDRRCERVRIALAGVDSIPVRATEAESALIGESLSDAAIAEAAAIAAQHVDPASDVHGSGDYRRHLVSALVTRALVGARNRSPKD